MIPKESYVETTQRKIWNRKETRNQHERLTVTTTTASTLATAVKEADRRRDRSKKSRPGGAEDARKRAEQAMQRPTKTPASESAVPAVLTDEYPTARTAALERVSTTRTALEAAVMVARVS